MSNFNPVTEIKKESLLYGDPVRFPYMASDAFGRVRVSEPFTQLDLKMIADNQSLLYSEAVTGSGEISYNSGESSVSLDVGATAGSAIRQSKLRGIYQPGKSLQILITGVLGNTATGITSRIGYYDANNGFYFQSKDGIFSIVRRSNVSGQVVETVINQADFNFDTMDETGNPRNPSNVLLDTNKTLIFGIDMEWLGVGTVRLFTVIDGIYFPLHVFAHANIEEKVYIANPNLPIRYEIINDGNGPASELLSICGTVMSEGGLDNNVRSTYISRLGTAQTLANQDLYTPLVSIRLKETHITSRILLDSIECFLTTNVNAEFIVVLNPTIAGTDQASWVSIADSAIEYDISRNNTNTVTGGAILSGGFIASSNANRQFTAQSLASLVSLGSAVNASDRDEIVLAMANIDANGGTAYGSITVREFN